MLYHLFIFFNRKHGWGNISRLYFLSTRLRKYQMAVDLNISACS